MQDVTNMDSYMQRMAQIFGPQMTQVLIDQDETARWYAERQQVPMKLLRSKEEQARLLQETIGQLAPALEAQKGGEPQ
jgi:hypothetical protein